MSKGKLIGTDAEKLIFADLMLMVNVDYQVNSRKSLKRAESAERRGGRERYNNGHIAMQKFLAPYFSSLVDDFTLNYL